MSNFKIPRLEKELFKLIINTLRFKVRDNVFSNIQITGVKLTPDLKYLKVYYYFENGKKIKKMEEKLRKVSGFIKKQIAGAGIMRIIPDIHYHYDETEEKANSIDKLLSTLRDDSYDDSSSSFNMDEFLLEDEYEPESFGEYDKDIEELFEDIDDK